MPIGHRGFITINGKIVGWFRNGLSDWECSYLSIVIGSAEAQQVLETLAILVALRIWKSYWKSLRIVITVRSDNMTALAAIAYFKASSHSTVAKLARELALEVADGTFAPEFNQHVPGAANIIADALSRRLQPGKTFTLPHALVGIAQTKLHKRNKQFFVAA